MKNLLDFFNNLASNEAEADQLRILYFNLLAYVSDYQDHVDSLIEVSVDNEKESIVFSGFSDDV